MKCALALVTALALSAPAAAQHTHGPQKGPNGGQMDDVAGVHAELLIASNIITINIYDEESKPVATAGFTGSAQASGFIDDTTAKIESRTVYFNRDFRDGHSSNEQGASKREESAQGFILNLQSGYTEGEYPARAARNGATRFCNPAKWRPAVLATD